MRQVSVLKLKITILTESPALNWLCAVFASRRYNAIRCHGRYWRLLQLPCGGQGVGGVGACTWHSTGFNDRWVQRLVAGKVQINHVSVPGWSRLNKYSKMLNSYVSFESNRILSNYSIRFEISNIRTALMKSNTHRPILSPSKMSSSNFSFWKYKLYVDICRFPWGRCIKWHWGCPPWQF